MKIYEKPSLNVIELQLTENIAKLPTTVYKGSRNSYSANIYSIALSQEATGLKNTDDYMNS